MKHTNLRWILVIPLLSFLPFQAAARNTTGPGYRDEERPRMGVARISATKGDVRMRHGKSGDSTAARAGQPLVPGDTVSTGRSSRAEIRLDFRNFIRLNGDTSVEIGQLGSRSFQVHVIRGLVTYSEWKHGAADMDIETPQVTVRPLKRGIYRVEVTPDGRTVINVRKGEAEVASAEGTRKLSKGRRMTIRGDADQAQFRLAKAEPKDSFDNWNKRRDKLLREDGPGGYSRFPGRVYLGLGYGYGYPHHLGFGYYSGYYRPYGYYAPRVRVSAVFRGRGGGHRGGRSGGRRR